MCEGRTPFGRFGTLPLLVALLIASISTTGCTDQLVETPATTSTIPSGEAFFRGIMMGEGDVAHQVPEIRELYAVEQTIAGEVAQQAVFEFNAELVETIRTTEPGYFDRFRTAMTSGDQVAISLALQEANRILAASLYELPKVKELTERINDDPEFAESLLAEADLEGMQASKEDVKNALYMFAAGGQAPGSGDTVAKRACIAIGPVFLVAAAVHMYAAVTHSAAAAVQVWLALAYWQEVATPEREAQAAFSSSKTMTDFSLVEEQLVNSIATTFSSAG